MCDDLSINKYFELNYIPRCSYHLLYWEHVFENIFYYRTVYTFVGGPEAIIEGALAAAKAAFPLIDMTKHKGKQDRLRPVLRTPKGLW